MILFSYFFIKNLKWEFANFKNLINFVYQTESFMSYCRGKKALSQIKTLLKICERVRVSIDYNLFS